MFHKTLSVGGTLVLGAVVVLAIPAPGRAQHGGHGGFGGGHAAGFGGGHYSGGGHVGGIGGYHGAVHYGGGFGGGYYGNRYYGNRYYGSHYYGGLGRWGGYYPYYSYYPYYGTLGYYNSYPDVGTYGYAAPVYGGTAAADSTSTEVHQALSSPSASNAPVDDVAHLTVQLPPDGRITVQGALMNSTGPIQQFVSPPLVQGSQYTYDIEAKWNENGQEVRQTRQVHVYAGARVEVFFRAGLEPTDKTTTPEKMPTASQP